MKWKLIILTVLSSFAGFDRAWGADGPGTPPPALSRTGKIDFSRQIQPIFNSSCAQCHLNGKRKGGLRLDSRNLMILGGDSGPAVAAHDPDKSLLIERVTSSDPDEVMPKKGPKLSTGQVALLRAWIEQGMPWEGALTSQTPPAFVAPLAPRRPILPAAAPGSSLSNPIDLILQSYFAGRHIILGAPVDDAVYARRVYLDVTGLLPTRGEMESFLCDRRPDKRERLVTTLLSESRKYAENWLSFWNDALRNDYQGTGYIDGGRKQITGYLYHALSTNVPYDQFVRDLIDPVPGAEGFTGGIIWRGAVSASQRRELQAAQSISQVFMGINLKCTSCHDSFISDWKLVDAYGLASVFADQPLEMFRCEKPTGKIAPVKFLYPQLGAINGTAPRAERLKRLAELMTSRENGRFARTMVNRMWARFLGHGLVEPVDEMDRKPWNEDLLDWLASNLADNGYDLKKTISLILTSRAYQMPAVGMRERDAQEFIFAGPVVRRLSAEQFCDAVWQLTDGWPAKAATDAYLISDSPPGPAPKARWIWKDSKAAIATEGLTIYLRKVVELPAVPKSAATVVTCDNRYTLRVNGKKASAGNDYGQPQVVDIKPLLVAGKNVLAVVATNDIPQTPNPAGFWLSSKIILDVQAKTIEVGTDASWQWSLSTSPRWDLVDFTADRWQPVADLGDVSMPPWNLGQVLTRLCGMSADTLSDPIRAVWINRDALMTALGRPNREQVVTSRTTYATMLQALEMTNGPELANLMHRGAEHWIKQNEPTTTALVQELFCSALGRSPTPSESSTCEQLVGAPVKQEGVEDLLWSVVMLPEFQLIR